jgi:hypothetical protein
MTPYMEYESKDVGPTLNEKWIDEEFRLSIRFRSSLEGMGEVRRKILERVRAVSPEQGLHSGHKEPYEYIAPPNMEIMSLTETSAEVATRSKVVLPIIYRERPGANGALRGIAWFDGTFYPVRGNRVDTIAFGKNGERFELIGGISKDQVISLENGDSVEIGKQFQVNGHSYVITREEITAFDGSGGKAKGLEDFKRQVKWLVGYARKWKELIGVVKVAELNQGKVE